MSLGTKSASNGLDIANLFDEFCSSVYNPSDSCLQNQSTYNNNKSFLISEVSISAVDIENSLNDLDITKGAGLDGVPKKILKYCLCLLYLPIFHIFNKSLTLAQRMISLTTDQLVFYQLYLNCLNTVLN